MARRTLSFDPDSPSSVDKFTFGGFDPLSECVALLDYDPFSNVLTLEFQERGTYEYYNVPPSVAYELAAADSTGRYFNSNIRRGHYAYAKLD